MGENPDFLQQTYFYCCILSNLIVENQGFPVRPVCLLEGFQFFRWLFHCKKGIQNHFKNPSRPSRSYKTEPLKNTAEESWKISVAFVVGQRNNEATNRCTRFVENQSEWHDSEDIHRFTNFHPIARSAASLPDAALVEKEWNLILQGSMTVRFHFVVLGSFQLQFLFRQFAMAFVYGMSLRYGKRRCFSCATWRGRCCQVGFVCSWS